MGIFDLPKLTEHEANEIERNWQYLINRPSASVAFEVHYGHAWRRNFDHVIDVIKVPKEQARRTLATLRGGLGSKRRVGKLLRVAKRRSIDQQAMHQAIAYWLLKERRDNDYDNLGEVFLTEALGIDLLPGELATFEKNAIHPIMPPDEMSAWARRYLRDRNLEELLSTTVPPALLLLASFTPVGRAGSFTYMTANALIGFVDYMYTVYTAEKDGDITDQEESEAFWALLGIAPFRIVELIITGRAFLQLGEAFLQFAIATLGALIDHIELMLEARNAGWDQGILLDLQTSVFIPDFALRDIRDPSDP